MNIFSSLASNLNMPPYFSINTIAELVCFLISLFCLFKEKNPFWKIFLFYMFLVYTVETSGVYLRQLHRMNFQIYTVFLIVECVVVSIFFYHLYFKYKKRVALLFYSWLAIFMLIYTIELANNHFKGYPYMTSAFMAVVFVIASCYFYLIVIRDEEFRELSTYPAFWIVNGILFFYFGGTACNIFYDYLAHEKLSGSSLSIRYIIFNILNVLLYSCWSYAFICRYRQRNLSSSSH